MATEYEWHYPVVMSEEESRKKVKTPVSPGLSIVGLFLTGIVGIIMGILVGSGVALLASVFSFGLVAWLSFR